MAKIWNKIKGILKCIPEHFELTEEQVNYAEDALRSLFDEKKGV